MEKTGRAVATFVFFHGRSCLGFRFGLGKRYRVPAKGRNPAILDSELYFWAFPWLATDSIAFAISA